MATESSEMPVGSGQGSIELTSGRVQIDTSAPFESVKEAASRFGGIGFWKPISHSHNPPEKPSQRSREIGSIVEVEEQTAELERDLVKKERETLDVLKELETTKNIVEELKLKLQTEASDTNEATEANEGKHGNDETFMPNEIDALNPCPSSAPGFILLELKQAKLNLKRTTDDLSDIWATVDIYNKKIEKETASLEKTRQRLSSNVSKVSCLEEELNQTRAKLELVKDAEVRGSTDDPLNVPRELLKLSLEAEQFRKDGEAVKSEVLRSISEIDQMKTRIRTIEIELVAAEKMKEGAKAAEVMAFMEIKALSSKENKDVTLTLEEYSSLVSKAREAEKAFEVNVSNAMHQIDEANVSKMQILEKVEVAMEEVKITKRALEEALSRVEAANMSKLAVEEELRIWRSEHGHKRRSIPNSTKFKNSYPFVHRKESHLLDVNGLNLASDELKPVPNPTLSIGQILGQKLLLTEEYENGMVTNKLTGKRRVSLGQMLTRPNADNKPGKENSGIAAKRKNFGFPRISFLVAKRNKKKKSLSSGPMCGSI